MRNVEARLRGFTITECASFDSERLSKAQDLAHMLIRIGVNVDLLIKTHFDERALHFILVNRLTGERVFIEPTIPG